MTATLRIAAAVFHTLRRHHLEKQSQVERLSFVFGRRVQAGDRDIILVPDQAPVLFADDCFTRQSAGNVRLDPAVLNGMLVDFAASDWDVIINVHDHWFSRAGTRFSGIDDADDRDFRAYLSDRFEPMLAAHPEIGPARPITLVSVVLDADSMDVRIVEKDAFKQVAAVQVIGEHFGVVRPNGAPRAELVAAEEQQLRHADFISPAVRAALASARFGLVGCGGLGSIIGEGLLRMGVRHITLVDEDRLEASNLNRWQGGRPTALGRPKAALLGENLAEMAPEADITVVCASLHSNVAEAALRGCDMLIGALDNDTARHVLNRIGTQYLMPYFDAAVRVIGGDAVDFVSRFFSVLPAVTGCLECTRSAMIDGEAVSVALLDAPTRRARAAAGYVEQVPEASAPSVYALNLGASATLLTEVLNHFAGYRRTAAVCRSLWRAGRTERFDLGDTHNLFTAPPLEDCPNCSFYHGRGDSVPLPRPGGREINLPELDLDTAGTATVLAKTPH
jgi:molybdopterin/thiamine biosynthesis adenylyltransferase